MMLRPYPAHAGPRLCQVWELVTKRQPTHSAKRSFVTLHTNTRPLSARTAQENPARPIATRLLTTSKPYLKVKRPASLKSSQGGDQSLQSPQSPQSPQSHNTAPSRFTTTVRSPETPERLASQPSTADLAQLAAAVDRVSRAFLAQQGIPSELTTLTALRACARFDVKVALDVQTTVETHAENPASLLLASSSRQAAERNARTPGNDVQALSSLRLEDVVSKISDAAYAIVSHPAVVITPQVLDEYVSLQARLGRPETLPQVLELFAAKPSPRLVSGSLRFTERNPHKSDSAIPPSIAEATLAAAMEAKDLDAALGIVENTYATKAFLRSKLIKKALLPAAGVGAVPVAAWLVAQNLALLQDSIDQSQATGIAFAGLIAYLGFTATIGVVAATTANDQMKRVTWAPGTPLSQRWLREEERSAMDKIACAFGFSEESRFGEEQGQDFLLLREYILRKGMELDVVNLMPGMS